MNGLHKACGRIPPSEGGRDRCGRDCRMREDCHRGSRPLGCFPANGTLSYAQQCWGALARLWLVAAVVSPCHVNGVLTIV
jgi:hypothetical protein